MNTADTLNHSTAQEADMTTTIPRIDHQVHQPPPVEWSSDHTARTVTRLAADVATIRRWVTFFGICFIIWLSLSALILMATIGAISDASS